MDEEADVEAEEDEVAEAEVEEDVEDEEAGVVAVAGAAEDSVDAEGEEAGEEAEADTRIERLSNNTKQIRSVFPIFTMRTFLQRTLLPRSHAHSYLHINLYSNSIAFRKRSIFLVYR